MFEENKKLSQSDKSLILIVCIGLLAGLFLKLFVIDILHVSGRSMEPAIKDDSVIFANRLAYGIAVPYTDSLFIQWAEPKAGDIVIYMYNNKIVVKRCVATGGDSLEYSDGPVYNLYVRDSSIPLSEIQYENMKSSTVVPEGYILAVGDNYRESVDSRNYGFVSVKNILGRIICR